MATASTIQRLVIEYDPLFSSVLGTGVNRRELLKWGSSAP
jgi:hypothetical protein